VHKTRCRSGVSKLCPSYVRERCQRQGPDRVSAGQSLDHRVGVTGFEPAASSSRTKRATKLRHTPWLSLRDLAGTRAARTEDSRATPLRPNWIRRSTTWPVSQAAGTRLSLRGQSAPGRPMARRQTAYGELRRRDPALAVLPPADRRTARGRRATSRDRPTPRATRRRRAGERTRRCPLLATTATLP